MSENRLLISLITPTYNEKENIPLLAEEIFKTVAEYPEIDLELIVVDDGSTDETPSVLAEFKDLRLRIHRKGHRGVAAARTRE